jgi:hypothetical protein
LDPCTLTTPAAAQRKSFPLPGHLDLSRPDRLAVWLGNRLSRGGQLCVTAYASSAVRVATAAVASGISLEGVSFITLCEPFTAAKRRTVEASGAKAVVRYAVTKAGILGHQCANLTSSDDSHFMAAAFALIEHTRFFDRAQHQGNGFLFTSLLRLAPKIMLNVEAGDGGVVTQRDCRCILGTVGLGTISHISGASRSLVGKA